MSRPNASYPVRKYTVHEIDEMRKVLERLVEERGMRGSTQADGSPGMAYGVPHTSEERAEQVERELRTHMLNGTEIAELQEQLAVERARVRREMGIDAMLAKMQENN